MDWSECKAIAARDKIDIKYIFYTHVDYSIVKALDDYERYLRIKDVPNFSWSDIYGEPVIPKMTFDEHYMCWITAVRTKQKIPVNLYEPVFIDFSTNEMTIPKEINNAIHQCRREIFFSQQCYRISMIMDIKGLYQYDLKATEKLLKLSMKELTARLSQINNY